MGALKLHEHEALRAAFDRAVTALLKLANALDDHERPSMGIDSMRRELITLKARHSTANDNATNQETRCSNISESSA